ncbi:hypothetical protein [Lacinutrix sp. Bg11-31]|uniref:hypothetical protein n=1 Tax=Lacinutrix sp. Bg11-31 TaxID=2057808 RepID=UPI000C31AD7E|nr:hypothetical protein [Lacinutrix sp. Bg11-31]AUC82651.1 hypothetical protein CW733_11145 [Lacinutrix sp. Bg11-31]
MKRKKVFKIIGIVLLIIIIAIAGIIGYGYYYYTEAHNTENKPYQNYIGYIDQDKALLKDKYELCEDGFIQRTYNGSALEGYNINKKHYRDQLFSQFNTNNYNDSGYLNFRFLVNCEGNAGWFEIIEMNLDLEETPLNKDLVDELLTFTSNSKHWNILKYPKNNKPYNYYNYISYRIENGKITQIIP